MVDNWTIYGFNGTALRDDSGDGLVVLGVPPDLGEAGGRALAQLGQEGLAPHQGELGLAHGGAHRAAPVLLMSVSVSRPAGGGQLSRANAAGPRLPLHTDEEGTLHDGGHGGRR